MICSPIGGPASVSPVHTEPAGLRVMLMGLGEPHPADLGLAVDLPVHHAIRAEPGWLPGIGRGQDQAGAGLLEHVLQPPVELVAGVVGPGVLLAADGRPVVDLGLDAVAEAIPVGRAEQVALGLEPGDAPTARAMSSPGSSSKMESTSITSVPAAARALHRGGAGRPAPPDRPWRSPWSATTPPLRHARPGLGLGHAVGPRLAGVRERERIAPVGADHGVEGDPRWSMAVRPIGPLVDSSPLPGMVRPVIGTRAVSVFSPDRPHSEAGMRIDPPPSEPVAERHHAGGDGGPGPARRATGRVVARPRVDGGAERDVVGRALVAVLGGVGLAHDDGAGSPEPGDVQRVGGGRRIVGVQSTNRTRW